jgi:hypothetical protein
MRTRSLVAALALALAATPALARPHHHHRAHHHRIVAGDDVRGARPAACAGIPWCGCWLRLHLGISDARLNLARAWAGVGAPASGPGAGIVAVWRHHVGLITADLGGGLIRLLSGNDGGAVRERVRSTRGIIALRKI